MLKKLLQIQKQELTVKKDANNPFFKSKYVTLDELLKVVLPFLTEAWLVMFHNIQNWALTTTITDVDTGDSVDSSIKLPETSDPQKMWSAITYYKRYNIWALLNIQTDEDDDWNKASWKKEEKKEAKWFNKPQLTKFMDKVKSKELEFDSWEKAVAYIKSVWYTVWWEMWKQIARYVEEFNKGTLNTLKKDD